MLYAIMFLSLVTLILFFSTLVQADMINDLKSSVRNYYGYYDTELSKIKRQNMEIDKLASTAKVKIESLACVLDYEWYSIWTAYGTSGYYAPRKPDEIVKKAKKVKIVRKKQ